VKSGTLLPGRKTVPERIRESRDPYVTALREVDKIWAQGNLELAPMEDYLATLVEAQLLDQD
jgi:hypothetical protein